MGKEVQVVVVISPELRKEDEQQQKKSKEGFYLSPQPHHEDCRQSCFAPYVILILGAIGAACASTSEAITKFAPNVGPASNLVFRNMFISSFCLPLLVAKNRQPLVATLGKAWKLILARSLLNCATFYFYFTALRRMPLAEASLVQSTWTALVTIFARIFLGEKIDRRKLASVALTLCGVAALSRIPELIFSDASVQETRHNSWDYWLGFSSVLLCAVAASGEALLLRKLRHVGDLPLLLSQGLSASTIFVGVGLVEGSLGLPQCGLEALLMVFHGLLGTVVQPIRSLCFKLEDASVVAVVLTSFKILYSFLFQAFFFKDAVDAYSITGTVLIFASLLFCGKRKSTK